MKSFEEWFKTYAGNSPHGWQADLGHDAVCGNRLIRVPTGLGKTDGILAAWLFNRVQRRDDTWPRRLVWCLPMRVLVEQTKAAADKILQKLGCLWAGKGDHAHRIGVHLLMGGCDADDWHLWPEECAVLIGTQDMLLSRTLNRGYAAPRARWPMEFGLLNQDCLWVMDEVQLMDVGLATSAQLQAYREQDVSKALRPCRTWWMSATLQRDWLSSVDTAALVASLPETKIAPNRRDGPLWQVSKPLRLQRPTDEAGIADLAAKLHTESKVGDHGRITLVVLNTVDRAVNVHEHLMAKRPPDTDVRLVHSRFRPQERRDWREKFLSREACTSATNRIIVATQVVEAGVDISATTLITEVAPWPSLVQRFGRAARWGGVAQVVVVTRDVKDDAEARPYTKAELDAATNLALARLKDVAQTRLEDFEAALTPADRKVLYPYSPRHLILRHEWDELFDTTPDLTGEDVDISRFIRSGDERDLHVFWQAVAVGDEPPPARQPSRDALCPVPFLKARDWLCGKEAKQHRLRKGMRAWVWDWLGGQWKRAERRDLYPGQTVLVAADCGGYSQETGWRSDLSDAVPSISDAAGPSADSLADRRLDDESLSAYPWKTIATHGRDVGELAKDLASRLAPDYAKLLDLAGRWHDAGKSHPCFQGSIRRGDRPLRSDLAKAPKDAWARKDLYRTAEDSDRRRGLRHELASALALFSVLQRSDSMHSALLGPWREVFERMGQPLDPASVGSTPGGLEAEILALRADEFDLLAYLICSHHGKVRLALHACPADQEYRDKDGRGQPIRGVRQDDALPKLLLCAGDGSPGPVCAVTLDLAPAAAGLSRHTGRSWTERSLDLLHRHGPATLAYLEALLRAADIRASKLGTPDPLLKELNP